MVRFAAQHAQKEDWVRGLLCQYARLCSEGRLASEVVRATPAGARHSCSSVASADGQTPITHRAEGISAPISTPPTASTAPAPAPAQEPNHNGIAMDNAVAKQAETAAAEAEEGGAVAVTNGAAAAEEEEDRSWHLRSRGFSLVAGGLREDVDHRNGRHSLPDGTAVRGRLSHGFAAYLKSKARRHSASDETRANGRAPDEATSSASSAPAQQPLLAEDPPAASTRTDATASAAPPSSCDGPVTASAEAWSGTSLDDAVDWSVTQAEAQLGPADDADAAKPFSVGRGSSLDLSIQTSSDEESSHGREDGNDEAAAVRAEAAAARAAAAKEMLMSRLKTISLRESRGEMLLGYLGQLPTAAIVDVVGDELDRLVIVKPTASKPQQCASV